MTMKRLGILLLLAACSSEPQAPPDLAGDWFAAFEIGLRSDGPFVISQSGADLTAVWTWTTEVGRRDTTVILDVGGTIVGDSVRFTSEAGNWTAGIVSLDELRHV